MALFASKSISYAIWIPSIARAHVTIARGTHFTAMGHSVPRSIPSKAGIPSEKEKTQKRLELLPEEALYLVERGSMFCWKEEGTGDLLVPGHEDVHGTPMSVQQAYADMLGQEDLTLDKYQVIRLPLG